MLKKLLLPPLGFYNLSIKYASFFDDFFGLKGRIGLLCCVGAKSEFGELTTFSEPLELFVVSISNEWNKFLSKFE